MKLSSLLSCVLAGALSGLATVASAADLQESDPNNVRSASVYIQRVAAEAPAAAASAKRTAAQPALLAEIRYDVLDPSTVQVVAYEPPEDGDDGDGGDAETASEAASPALYRIGLYDPQSKQWLGATSVAAASNFAKGYRPYFVLTVAETGPAGASSSNARAPSAYLGVSMRGMAIDAGATRDFGPQAAVVVTGRGPAPVLNRPVVLDPAGKKAPPEEEKTFLQK